MPATPFNECKYSVFFSYAHEDNRRWQNWITDFRDELRNGLPSRISGAPVPPIHLSEGNGPINGVLDEELYEAIKVSFAMIVFVHDNYLESDWCLQELAHFSSLFGDDGFRQRLFIVAMSKAAIDELTARKEWKELCGKATLVWMQFYRQKPEETGWPINMYVTDPDRPHRKVVIATDFWELFLRLREKLVDKFKVAVQRETRATSYPTAAARLDTDTLVRVFIEADSRQEQYWESLGRQVVASWDQVVALEVVEPPLLIRPEKLKVGDVETGSALDDANGVILLWAKKSADSIAAEINALEPRLSGPRFAPGLIAYLMTSPADRPASASIFNWPVVCFLARPDGSTTVLADDAPKLSEFMRRVLKHKRGA